MFVSFRHPAPTQPGYRYTAEAARSVIGQTFPVRVGAATVMGTATECELVEDSGELWLTVEVPDDTPWLDAIKP